MKETIIRKLTSRKLWISVACFVAMLMVYCGAPEDSAAAVASLIMAGAVVISYVLAEGWSDAADEEIVVDVGDVIGIEDGEDEEKGE